MDESENEMLNTEQVLEKLKISKTTLYRLMKEERLLPVGTNHLLKRQRKLLFRRSDVEALLNSSN